MTLKSSYCVHVEKPETALGQIMSDIRAWLDHQQIQPVEFKCLPTEPGILGLDIRFEREEDAQLFEQTFA